MAPQTRSSPSAALARTWSEGPASFSAICVRSLHLTSAFAIPLGILGLFFAEDVLRLLFGAEYASAASALEILGLAAVLVVLWEPGALRSAVRVPDPIAIKAQPAA